jgi:hypothetical protein
MRFGLRCLRVFVDQSVEDLSAADPRRGEIGDGRPGVRGVAMASSLPSGLNATANTSSSPLVRMPGQGGRWCRCRTAPRRRTSCSPGSAGSRKRRDVGAVRRCPVVLPARRKRPVLLVLTTVAIADHGYLCRLRGGSSGAVASGRVLHGRSRSGRPRAAGPGWSSCYLRSASSTARECRPHNRLVDAQRRAGQQTLGAAAKHGPAENRHLL